MNAHDRRFYFTIGSGIVWGVMVILWQGPILPPAPPPKPDPLAAYSDAALHMAAFELLSPIPTCWSNLNDCDAVAAKVAGMRAAYAGNPSPRLQGEIDGWLNWADKWAREAKMEKATKDRLTAEAHDAIRLLQEASHGESP